MGLIEEGDPRPRFGAAGDSIVADNVPREAGRPPESRDWPFAAFMQHGRAIGRFDHVGHVAGGADVGDGDGHPVMDDVEDFADDHLGWDAERMLAHTEALYDPDLHQRVVTHGDFSLGNLLMDERGDVTGCIDVGLLGVADPYQDIAILCANLGELDPAAERAFLDAIGVASPDRQRMAFHRCLDELF